MLLSLQIHNSYMIQLESTFIKKNYILVYIISLREVILHLKNIPATNFAHTPMCALEKITNEHYNFEEAVII